ncbi:unnamed protein product [Vicia faba]|uniref:Uncharacterized protein n=1 Tax=Vicia faba TaxID=3906 RepID=A0AAV1A2Y5_VICFA|nr:unnamed protein product [Vicia faba]
MGDRIEALETQMESVTTTLQGLALQMQHHAKQMQQQSLILTELSKQIENPFEALSTLRQTGNVEEFVEAFELLSSQVGQLPEALNLNQLKSHLLRAQQQMKNLEDKAVVKDRGVVRDLDEEVGLDFGHKPKVWRVYTRIRDKGIKE